jgi:hypothetical protein
VKNLKSGRHRSRPCDSQLVPNAAEFAFSPTTIDAKAGKLTITLPASSTTSSSC